MKSTEPLYFLIQMPHESTVEHEKIAKRYGPIENACRGTADLEPPSKTPCVEHHECDVSDDDINAKMNL